MTDQEKRQLMELMACMNDVRARIANPLGPSRIPLGLAVATICPAGMMFLIWALYLR